MILLKTLGIVLFPGFFEFFVGVIVDFREGEGEGYAANHIDNPVHIGIDATHRGETDKCNHDDIKNGTRSFILDIAGKNNHGDKENCSYNHDMSGGEGRFVG